MKCKSNKFKCILILKTIVLLSFILSIVGCSKVIDVQTKSISATIVNTEYIAEYSITNWITINNTLMPQTTDYPPEYNVTLEYDGIKYRFDNFKYFNICKGNAGKKVKCTLYISKYDDGTYKTTLHDLTGLED